MITWLSCKTELHEALMIAIATITPSFSDIICELIVWMPDYLVSLRCMGSARGVQGSPSCPSSSPPICPVWNVGFFEVLTSDYITYFDAHIDWMRSTLISVATLNFRLLAQFMSFMHFCWNIIVTSLWHPKKDEASLHHSLRSIRLTSTLFTVTSCSE